MGTYHEPVLLHESIDGLAIKKGGVYADVTYGGGGHSQEILNRLDKKGRLIAFDRDGDSATNKAADSRLLFINHNFKFLKNYLKYNQIFSVDGILADLGVSSYQFDNPGRGFSTRFDGGLDLRMDRRQSTTAADIINNYERGDLIRIFREFGELAQAHRLADLIIQSRSLSPILTTVDLKASIASLSHKGRENKFLAQVFQALRIEVNQELDALKVLLTASLDILSKGGRLVVISYHSLEDRLVKNFMRSGNFTGEEFRDPLYGHTDTPFRLITKKPIVPGEKEIQSNNRARSARLRIAEKK
jgi:16S rRNA (cytosine1402-N4)-methyltransferase